MSSCIDFHEVLIDSPTFRYKIENQESEIENLEQKLDKILKLATTAIDSGRVFVVNQSAFATSLWDLQKNFPEDKDALTKIIHCLQEMNKFNNILLEQCAKTVLKNISNFLKKDVREVKDYKQIFLKISENYDMALLKHSQVNKNRPHEIIEAENYVFSTKSQFQHSALDYVNYITLLQSKKRPEILSTLLSYVSACSTYFHQGSDLCQDYDTFLFKELDEEINNMRVEYSQLEKEMQKRHNYVNGQIEEPSTTEIKESSTDTKVVKRQMEGYLFKRTSNAFKTWNRRWFFMKDNKLYYRKRSGEELPTVMEEDLKLCTVRPLVDSDRRFCFEVISPTKSHTLQADSKFHYDAWIKALQSAILCAFEPSNSRSSAMSGLYSTSNPFVPAPSNRPKEKKINWRALLTIAGNMTCADCGNPDPKWASINLGITLCIACSGVHRSLGVHFSKVRSLTLDHWEPEIVRVMNELGNEVVNKIYEGTYDELMCEIERATEFCDDKVRKEWIQAKYVDKKFILPLNDDSKKTDLLPSNLIPSPSKWSVKKYRRRATKRHNNNNDMKITSKEHDNSSDEKEINESILILGDRLTESNYSVTSDASNLFTSSDQESTSGEEDVLDEEEIDKLNPNSVLAKAALAHNLPVMSQAIALGADKNWENSENLNRTPLHQAVLVGSLMTCEYLILNGANLNPTDSKGYTPLHLAIESGNTALAYLLLKHKAKYDVKTNDGKLPIDFAVSSANADVVTLLRLHQLNEEIGATDDAEVGGDSTYNDVMRDFSHLANNQRLRGRRDCGSSSSSSMTNSNLDNISND